MIFYFHLFLIVLRILKVFSKQAEYKQLVNAYNKCMEQREHSIRNSLHLNAIVCNEKETCVLKSNVCLSPLKTVESVWLKEDDKSLEKHTIDKNFSLIIESAELTDEGYYWELIYNETVINEYHLTVLDRTSGPYPVYEKDFVIPTQNSVQITWSEWSECKCSRIGELEYRTRYGKCFTKQASTRISKYYNNRLLPCQSKLITEKLSFSRLDYKMYGDCNSICFNDSNNNNVSLKLKTRIETVSLQLGSFAQLDCGLLNKEKLGLNKNSYARLNIKWEHEKFIYRYDLKQSFSGIFVDKRHRLFIKSVSYSDKGEFTCFYNEKKLKIVLVNVYDDQIKANIYSYTIRIACVFVVATLILVNVLAFMQRKSIRNKLE